MNVGRYQLLLFGTVVFFGISSSCLREQQKNFVLMAQRSAQIKTKKNAKLAPSRKVKSDPSDFTNRNQLKRTQTQKAAHNKKRNAN